MKTKLDIKKEVPLQPEILEEKINNYLKKNSYRVIEKGPGFIIFIDDEYSDRKRYRSDYHTRIGEGKFEFNVTEQGTYVRLIYLTPILYPLIIMIIFAAGGAYLKSLIPILMSFALAIPVIHRIYYLKEHVFNEILDADC